MIETITIPDVWSAVGVFNEKKIPVGFKPGFCCSKPYKSFNLYAFCPIGITIAANHFDVFDELVIKRGLFDKFCDVCVILSDKKYGADFFYYFGKGFDLRTSQIETIRKFEWRKEVFKSGVLCRERFVYDSNN